MTKKNTEVTCDERRKEILSTIIKLHVSTGEPVGSNTLAMQSKKRLSAATIRNIMAELEEAGYLTHPHTSAGRIPTDKGYRFYVDNLIYDFQLSPSDEEKIHRSLIIEPGITPEQLMERASQLLSQMSTHVGIVLSPSPAQDILQHIEFIRLSEKQILVITVSKTGSVYDQVIRVDEDLSQDELDKTTRYIIQSFKDFSLSSIRNELLNKMSEEKVLYDRLLKNAILLCDQSLSNKNEHGEVYVDGTVNILNQPYFHDLDRMKALFKMFEEKGRLVKILNQCLSTVTNNGISVQIGSENKSPGMRDCTIITSPYYYNDQLLGGISVVGPTRMEYIRIMNVVSYIAVLFNYIINRPFADAQINLERVTRKPKHSS